MTFSPGMMQTAANEATAMEEKAKGTGGLCVCVFMCVCSCVCVCVRADECVCDRLVVVPKSPEGNDRD